MGLDMYLYKMPRCKGATAKDVALIEDYFTWKDSGQDCTLKERGGTLILLHRLVMEPIEPNMVVDHKEHPGRMEHKFDNRKSNLRITTHANNLKNQIRRTDNTSGVTGVYWDDKSNKWYVRITSNNTTVNVGYFNNKDDAIQARKNAENQYFGEYRYDAYNS